MKHNWYSNEFLNTEHWIYPRNHWNKPRISFKEFFARFRSISNTSQDTDVIAVTIEFEMEPFRCFLRLKYPNSDDFGRFRPDLLIKQNMPCFNSMNGWEYHLCDMQYLQNANQENGSREIATKNNDRGIEPDIFVLFKFFVFELNHLGIDDIRMQRKQHETSSFMLDSPTSYRTENVCIINGLTSVQLIIIIKQ